MSADIVIFPSVRVERYGDEAPAASAGSRRAGMQVPSSDELSIFVRGHPLHMGVVELRINGQAHNLTAEQARDLSQTLVRAALTALGQP